MVTIVWTIFRHSTPLECRIAVLNCYRHIAPLEQRSTTYPCARRNPYRTNNTDMKMSPHASGVILLRSENRNKMQRAPHSSGVLCKEVRVGHKCAFR